MMLTTGNKQNKAITCYTFMAICLNLKIDKNENVSGCSKKSSSVVINIKIISLNVHQ